jgi:hypothetical protein
MDRMVGLVLLLFGCGMFGLQAGLLAWNAANGSYGWVGFNAGAALLSALNAGQAARLRHES